MVAGLAATILFGWLFPVSESVGLYTTLALRGIVVVGAVRCARRGGRLLAVVSAGGGTCIVDLSR